MRQVYHNICTYSADLFGINSALYELGGLIVMHDASGCNSTYNTHDEPRWYSMDSMVYVSGLNEKDAILGNDRRVIEDISAVAKKEGPKFIVFSLSVLPAYMGTDARGIARLLEKETGIPAFGFATNGMDTYVRGAGMAFRAIAERFCPAGPKEKDEKKGGLKERDQKSINLFGVTPLDFSVNGNVEALEAAIREMGFAMQSNWAMGCSLEDLKTAPQADVSLVVSVTGLPAAKYFYEAFGIPYVIGLPCGRAASRQLKDLLCQAIESGQNGDLFSSEAGNRAAGGAIRPSNRQIGEPVHGPSIRLIGEPVHCASIRRMIEAEWENADVRILCPFEEDGGILRDEDWHETGEERIRTFLNQGDIVIADPVYRRITEPRIHFIDDPHDAYSGRMYHDRGRIFVGQKGEWIVEECRLGKRK